VATVGIFQFDRLPALPAACVPVTHESVVGRFGAWGPPMPGASVPPRPVSDYRTSGSIGHKIAGNRIAMVDTQFTGDVRGVPPRGKPV
jgi:hypothetical protein